MPVQTFCQVEIFRGSQRLARGQSTVPVRPQDSEDGGGPIDEALPGSKIPWRLFFSGPLDGRAFREFLWFRFYQFCFLFLLRDLDEQTLDKAEGECLPGFQVDGPFCVLYLELVGYRFHLLQPDWSASDLGAVREDLELRGLARYSKFCQEFPTPFEVSEGRSQIFDSETVQDCKEEKQQDKNAGTSQCQHGRFS